MARTAGGNGTDTQHGITRGLWERLFCFYFILLGAAPAAYGSSQARVESELQLLANTRATATLHPSPSATHTTAHGNAGSLTH